VKLDVPFSSSAGVKKMLSFLVTFSFGLRCVGLEYKCKFNILGNRVQYVINWCIDQWSIVYCVINVVWDWKLLGSLVNSAVRL
jgi:hypothetical protein